MSYRSQNNNHRVRNKNKAAAQAPNSKPTAIPARARPQIELKLKKLKLEEDRLNRVDHENRRLLHRLVSIIEGPPSIDCYNYYVPSSKRHQQRKAEELRIVRENERMVQRILKAKPTFERAQFGRHRQASPAVVGTQPAVDARGGDPSMEHLFSKEKALAKQNSSKHHRSRSAYPQPPRARLKRNKSAK